VAADARLARTLPPTGFPTLTGHTTNLRRQPSLRSQLNQIRMWVRQGRTDAWIAHKLDVSIDELARFKREHELDGGGETTHARPADPLSVPPPEPRSADLDEPDEPDEEVDEEPEEPRRERPRRRSRSRTRRPAAADVDDEDEAEEDREPPVPVAASDDDERDEDDADGAPRRRRRRGRRGGRRHRGRRNAYEATFDHGEEGYGLWLDPSVAENPVYSEHWAGHRAVTVTFEADAITIRRADPPGPGSDEESDSGD
jgi:hypothetical protein